jgi:ParB family chromosome partitioning protein
MDQQLRIDYVPPGRLRPNPWNTNRISDPAIAEKLKNSLRHLGFPRPIMVRTLPDGTLEILGGEHRWRYSQEMPERFPTVPVINLGLIDDRKAKEIGLMDNARYGEDDPLGLATLMKDLGAGVLDFLPISELEFDTILKTSDISLEDLDSVDKADLPDLNAKKAPPSTVIMRFKVPIEDQGWLTTLIDGAMKQQNFADEDSLSKAGHALMWLLKRAKDTL